MSGPCCVSVAVWPFQLHYKHEFSLNCDTFVAQQGLGLYSKLYENQKLFEKKKNAFKKRFTS